MRYNTLLFDVDMGPLELDEQLAVGEYRSLTLAEMKKLSIYFK